MTYVWTVEAGEYSDYRIVGIYSTESGANRAAQAIESDEDEDEEYRVCRRDLDPAVDELNAGLTPHRIHMHYDGAVYGVYEDRSAFCDVGWLRVDERTTAWE
jgi:hypothetical protein